MQQTQQLCYHVNALKMVSDESSISNMILMMANVYSMGGPILSD